MSEFKKLTKSPTYDDEFIRRMLKSISYLIPENNGKNGPLQFAAGIESRLYLLYFDEFMHYLIRGKCPYDDEDEITDKTKDLYYNKEDHLQPIEIVYDIPK